MSVLCNFQCHFFLLLSLLSSQIQSSLRSELFQDGSHDVVMRRSDMLSSFNFMLSLLALSSYEEIVLLFLHMEFSNLGKVNKHKRPQSDYPPIVNFFSYYLFLVVLHAPTCTMP